MRNYGVPKQFLKLYGRPIVAHTVDKFEKCNEIDEVVIVCNNNWLDLMNEIIHVSSFRKVKAVVAGGKDRQDSIQKGLHYLTTQNAADDDIIVIHDAVRPLVEVEVLRENVYAAQKYGCAMTVRATFETIAISNKEKVGFDGFFKRDDTYSLTSPQTFKLQLLLETYHEIEKLAPPIPLLDPALAYTFLGNEIYMVKENNRNIKITTPEDFYMLKAMFELEESRHIFGL